MASSLNSESDLISKICDSMSEICFNTLNYFVNLY